MNPYDIRNVAEKLGLKEENLIPYGFDKAKIDLESLPEMEKKGKLILCTAITPTKAGEGKTTTAIGLADGLSRLSKNAIACLREPSLGPVFGVKGGGAGGGQATLYPEEDINLHFTGDMHAITSVNNLIAALIDNELYQGSKLDVDPERIVFPRAMDMNDRSLRDIETCLNDKKGIPHRSGFVITAASEIMACFCLCRNLDDFIERVNSITVAYDRKGNPILVRQLESSNAIRKLIKTALLPNLVQTKYHTPALVHGGPFANIAHGTNSIIATDLALRLSDYVVTESGFGSDLGMEKYMDIVSHVSDNHPDLVVLVCSIRALKLHGGVSFDNLEEENIQALETGLANLNHHIHNIEAYHVPYVVSINHFDKDSEREPAYLMDYLRKKEIPFALNTSYTDGPDGAIGLAETVLKAMENPSNGFTPIVNSTMSLEEKISVIARTIYGSDKVEYEPEVLKELRDYENSPYADFDVCISKVPTSLSDDPHLLNDPKHTTLHIRKLRLFTGARFLVPLTGEVFTMPGLPKVPASKKM